MKTYPKHQFMLKNKRYVQPLMQWLLASLFILGAVAPVRAQTGPGGVGNGDGSGGQPENALWLRANKDVTGATPVTSWGDQSGNNNDATSNRGPDLASSVTGLNNQPALLFDGGNNEFLSPSAADELSTRSGGFSEKTYFMVFRTGSDVSTRQTLYEQGGSGAGLHFYIESDTLYASAWSNSWSNEFYALTHGVSANTSYQVTFIYDDDASNRLSLFVDGVSEDTESSTGIGVLGSHGNAVGIGFVNSQTRIDDGTSDGDVSTSDDPFSGHIAEMAFYNEALSTPRQQIIENALGDKYGISLPSANDRYAYSDMVNGIIGIGQLSGVNHTDAANGILSFANVTLANDEFVLLGNNDGSDSTLVNETDPTNIGEKLDRVWRYDAANTPEFDLAFDVSEFPALASGQNYRLIVDNDATFTSSSSVVSGSLSSGVFTIADAETQLSDGDYFTLAKTATNGPSTLVYDPDTIEALRTSFPLTATATVSGNNGSVSYSISAGSDNAPAPTYGTTTDATTQDVEINPSTGAITINSSAPIGIFSCNVDVTDNDATVTFSDAVTFIVQEAVTIDYATASQSVVFDGANSEAIQATSPNSVSINEGSVSYAQTDGDDLGTNGLSLNTSTGEITGTPNGSGHLRAVIEITGTGAAAGTASQEVHFASVGSDGPGGIGDAVSLVGDFDASDISATNGATINTLDDGSAYNNDASGSGSSLAIYNSSASGLNGQPALDFSSATDFYTFSSNQFNGGGGFPYTQRTQVAVFETGSNISSTTPEGIFTEGGGSNGLSIYTRDGDLYAGIWSRSTGWGPYFFSAESNATDGGTGTVTINASEAYMVVLVYNYAESLIEAYVNGTLIGRQSTDVGRFSNHNNVIIGGGDNLRFDGGSSNYDAFTGLIGDLVTYEVALTNAQRQLLEASLGAKYGIAVSNSRYDLSGTEEFTYNEEVVGVGRSSDNPQPFDPVQSTSILTATPDASVTLSNGDFSVLGHEGGNLAFTSEPDIGDFEGTTADQSDDVDARLERVWRIDINGTSAFDYADLAFDVSAFSALGTNQSYLLIADSSDATFSSSATVVEGTLNSGVFTPDGTVTGGLSNLTGGSYFTLARTQGNATPPSNLSYAPAPLRVDADATSNATSTPTFDGGQPLPTFSITSPSTVPSGISIDANSGVVTVDPTTVAQDIYTVTIEADNSATAGGGTATTTLDIEVFETLDDLSFSDGGVFTVSHGRSISTTPVITPDPSTINSGSIAAYSIQRVNAFGTIQGDLSGTGLSLNTTTGVISGTLSQNGTVNVQVEATGTGAAEGSVSDNVKITSVGATGVAGIGDATTTLVELKAEDLSLNNNDPVATWTDASNYGNDATQTTSGDQPTFVTNAVNGRPAVRFDGGDDLDIASTPQLNSGGDPYLQKAYTIVFRTGSSLSGNQFLWDQGGGSRNYQIYLSNTDLVLTSRNNQNDALTNPGSDNLTSSADPTTPWEAEFNGDGIVTLTETGLQANTTYVVSMFIDFARGAMEMWLNGTSRGTVSGVGRQYDHSPTQVGRGFDGDIPLISVTDASLSEAQRVILHNSLAARYGITLASGATQSYSDPGGFGDDIIGIGEIGGEAHTLVEGGELRLELNSGLDDGDFVSAGHNGLSGEETTDFTTAAPQSTTLDARLERIWYFDVTDAGTNLTADITFTLDDVDFSAITTEDVRDYYLLYRSSTSGSWTEVKHPADAINSVTFNNIDVQDGYYTLGTLDNSNSPLPVELTDFTAQWQGEDARLEWTTASELNNSHFEVQRSRDGDQWKVLDEVEGHGTTTQAQRYGYVDALAREAATEGRLFYRLEQFDFDGTSAYSPVVLLRSGRTEEEERDWYAQLEAEGGRLQVGNLPEDAQEVRLWSSSGRPLDRWRVEGQGSGVRRLPLRRPVAAGLYMVEVQGATGSSWRKVIRR